jgi:hypothetical protein
VAFTEPVGAYNVRVRVLQGSHPLHWPLVVADGSMLERLGRKELEAKRLEDDRRWALVLMWRSGVKYEPDAAVGHRLWATGWSELRVTPPDGPGFSADNSSEIVIPQSWSMTPAHTHACPPSAAIPRQAAGLRPAPPHGGAAAGAAGLQRRGRAGGVTSQL